MGQPHSRAALATSIACQLPGARKAPTSHCHVAGSPQNLKAWSGQSTEVGVTAMGPALWKQTRPLHRPPPRCPASSTFSTGTSFWNRALLLPGFQLQAPAGLLSSLTAWGLPESGCPSPLNQHVALCGQRPRQTTTRWGPSCRHFTSATTVAASAQAARQDHAPSLLPGTRGRAATSGGAEPVSTSAWDSGDLFG